MYKHRISSQEIKVNGGSVLAGCVAKPHPLFKQHCVHNVHVYVCGVYVCVQEDPGTLSTDSDFDDSMGTGMGSRRHNQDHTEDFGVDGNF